MDFGFVLVSASSVVLAFVFILDYGSNFVSILNYYIVLFWVSGFLFLKAQNLLVHIVELEEADNRCAKNIIKEIIDNEKQNHDEEIDYSNSDTNKFNQWKVIRILVTIPRWKLEKLILILVR